MITISQELISEIIKALTDVGSYGSVELIVQDSQVTQITTRSIKKTNTEEPTTKLIKKPSIFKKSA